MIEEALDHCNATGERWLYAELARMKGTILMAAGVGVRAGEWLAVALTTSRQQHAWTFEARANEAFAKWLSDRRNHGQDELLMHRARKEEATSVLLPLLVSLTGRSAPDPIRA